MVERSTAPVPRSPLRFRPRRPIDFMKYRRFWVALSLVLITGFGVWVAAGGRPRLGTELAGGTQLTLRFREPVDVERLRSAQGGAGLAADIQTLGPLGENTFLVAVPPVRGEAVEADRVVQDALDAALQPEVERRRDVNRIGRDAVLDLLGATGLSAEEEAAAASRVSELRRERGVVASWSEVAADGAVSGRALEALRSESDLGAYAVLSRDTITPQVGRELAQRGLAAVGLALLAMLGYIAVRFELPFGVGAVMASIHDVLVAMGLFVLCGFEVDLTTVAALLTLVGYSVNDTVVVFDRVRENRKAMPRLSLEELINRSVNDTLARTLMTSFTTLCAAVPLLVLGGEALRGFSFVLTVGVIVGTYSTIYIAGPFTLLWESLRRGSAREEARPRGAEEAEAEGTRSARRRTS